MRITITLDSMEELDSLLGTTYVTAPPKDFSEDSDLLIAISNALAREDALVDEVVKWRRLALAWRRRILGAGNSEDFDLTLGALNLDDHIKLVEGGE